MVMIGRKEFVKTHQFSTKIAFKTVLASLSFSLSLFALSLSFLSLPFLLSSPSFFFSFYYFFFETYAGVEPRLFQVDGYGVIQKALARSVLVAKALLPVG